MRFKRKYRITLVIETTDPKVSKAYRDFLKRTAAAVPEPTGVKVVVYTSDAIAPVTLVERVLGE